MMLTKHKKIKLDVVGSCPWMVLEAYFFTQKLNYT